MTDTTNIPEETAIELGDAWAAYVTCVGEHYADPDDFDEAYEGHHGTMLDFAYSLAESGVIEVNTDTLEERYFDWEAFARDLEHDYSIERGFVFRSL